MINSYYSNNDGATTNNIVSIINNVKTRNI